MALSSMLNSERVVVFLYVAQILYSTPLALIHQAISITLLSIFALAIELSTNHASNPLDAFATRFGRVYCVFRIYLDSISLYFCWWTWI